MSRKDRFVRNVKASKRLVELKHKLKLSPEEFSMVLSFLNESVPLTVNNSIFLTSLKNLAADWQSDYIRQAENHELFGSYSQTELAHGSDVQALKTTATYIRETDEFEIHTPDIEAIKWWPGGLGWMSSHTIVFAQLIIDGKRYSPQPFLVQIRSREDHKPLRGIEVGDIGPKIGFNTTDNGFLRLDHVRIPRTNMLMKFASVDKNGVFKTLGDPKAVYASMLAIRVNMVGWTAYALAKASVIATRYSIVRRQFNNETQILDYKSQQNRVLPSLVGGYATSFVGEWLREEHRLLTEDINKNKNFERLAQLHSSAAALKSDASFQCVAGIEECRRACGGHGYSQFSGLPELLNLNLQMITAEGENLILTQQVTRYLLKVFQDVQSGKPATRTVSYFNDWKQLLKENSSAKSIEDMKDLRVLLRAMEHRVIKLVVETAKSIQTQMGKGLTPAQAFAESLLLVNAASRAHATVLTARAFLTRLEKLGQSPLSGVLTRVAGLWGLSRLANELGDFAGSTHFSSEQVNFLREAYRDMLGEVRVESIGLADAWEFSDHTLNSCLGRYDGNVYEALYKRAKQDPLNHQDTEEFRELFEKHLKPMIHSKL
eukprot:TRINITY_DN618_c0_g1_i1.p1 TRINITY_DN618_c0_g1~~TRINITY_DN618_c0_g1_i1.p1  ORF type:complete len:664 (-),score=192.51 TRINITY_DN618_c0_g1_i1:1215-3020(-)